MSFRRKKARTDDHDLIERVDNDPSSFSGDPSEVNERDLKGILDDHAFDIGDRTLCSMDGVSAIIKRRFVIRTMLRERSQR